MDNNYIKLGGVALIVVGAVSLFMKHPILLIVIGLYLAFPHDVHNFINKHLMPKPKEPLKREEDT